MVFRLRPRRCTKGDLCGHAHTDEEMCATDGIHKTHLCIFFVNRSCKKRSRCKHAHGKGDLHVSLKYSQQIQVLKIGSRNCRRTPLRENRPNRR